MNISDSLSLFLSLLLSTDAWWLLVFLALVVAIQEILSPEKML